MPIDYITFDGNKYMTRDVRLEEYKVTVKVAQEELDSALFDEKEGYSSREAELLDELIYTFIPASLMEASDDEIAEYIYEKNEELYNI
ncbi:MAG: hypothetical protein IKI38_01950 [Mogibacterium sp.]|nr:hypothetical protein [Mogibacterium sp.]